MLKGWNNLHDPKVLSSFARVAYSRLTHHRSLMPRDAILNRSDKYSSPNAFREEILHNHTSRRNVLLEVLRISSDPESIVWGLISSDTPLCTPDDFEFLIDLGIDVNEETLKNAIVYMAIQVFNYDRDDHVKKLFNMVDQKPVYAERYSGLLYVRIDTPQRELWLKLRKQRHEQQGQAQKQIEIQLNEFEHLIERIENGG